MITNPLFDSHQRSFEYLRLSVTDRCNFKCTYCLPQGYQKNTDESELSVVEIRRLVTAFAELGFFKVRLTGGEPTLRHDIVEIAHTVSSVPGIERVALSTNGSRLKELAPALRTAGVQAINISLDSLNEEGFKKITGTRRFEEVLESVHQALLLGFSPVKINVVLLKSHFDLKPFLSFIQAYPVSIRFIELMRTAENKTLFDSEHVSAAKIKQELLELGFAPLERARADGPAQNFTHSDFKGSIGIIAPYSKDFCQSCNRLRVTARGDLRLCLFGEGKNSLRDLLQDDSQKHALQNRVIQALGIKKGAHQLNEGHFGDTPNLSVYGG